MKPIQNYLSKLFEQIGLPLEWSNILTIAVAIIALLLIIILIQWAFKFILTKLANNFFKRTKTRWDDFLIERKVFNALAHFVASIILYKLHTIENQQLITNILAVVAQVYGAISLSILIIRLIKAANDMYETTAHAHERPIRGYIQLVQILIIFLTIIFVIAIILNKDPLKLIAGLGVMASVLMLVFKDSILGFVASMQLSLNNMVNIGDWIEMPSHKADGTVIDINLTAVKVQNWDKTITTIPTYALVSGSFSNWSGMEKSGGRRIKRSINIDMKSVRFCDEKMLEKFKHFYLLRDYIANKEEEIRMFNEQLNVKPEEIYNGRRQTNLGIFRHYLDNYLKNHPQISKEMTFLVRHLQPTEKGIPLEIYVFSKEQRWAYYEGIQADIFDHVLAILPEFELQIFQNPSGSDMVNLIKEISESLKNTKPA